MIRATRVRYTLEFKQEAVRLVESGQRIASASRTLGLVGQTLFNWVKAHREGTLKGADSRSKVTAEQMEISRLRAELARCTQIPEYVLEGCLAAFKSRNLPSCLYSNAGPKPMHGKRVVSSLCLYPGQTSAGTSSGFYVQQSGISVQ